MKKRILVSTLIFLLVSLISFAIDVSPAKTKEVKVAFGLTLPPYVFENGSGMEYEIIQRSLAVKGYTLKAEIVPFARLIKVVKDKEVDAAATINESSGIKDAFFSDVHIKYQNVAIALAEKKLKIEKISDLSNKSVVSFQNAPLYLGAEFGEMAKNNKEYSEIANQDQQVGMLYKERADALVMDINIFKYFKKNTKLVKESEKKEETIYPIFQPVLYKVCFVDKKVCDDFNEGLKEIKKSGEYDKIIAKYISAK